MISNQIKLLKGWNLTAIQLYSIGELLSVSTNIISIYRLNNYYEELTNNISYIFNDNEAYWIYCEKDVVIPSYTIFNSSGRYNLIESYNHNNNLFTQGLVFYKGKLYEGTGLYGKSLLQQIELDGNIINKINLKKEYFGEGITIYKDKIYQLTWKSKVILIYNLSLELIQESYIDTNTTEGWGITNDDENLIVSDGSDVIHFFNPITLKLIKKIFVNENGNKVSNLNELEYINGYIFSNIWKTNDIIIINSNNGNVIKRINILLPLKQDINPNQNVLNGIAVNEKENEIFITGKFWNKIYKIELY